MKLNCFQKLVRESPNRIACPIATYPALALTGANVSEIVTNPSAQVAAQEALLNRYQMPILLAAMDLSAEAEAFGCDLYLAENEIPSVTGRLVTTLGDANALRVPVPGEKRTSVYLDTVRRLKSAHPDCLVFGGCIGPFSLSSRLVGVSEALELTVTEPELMHAVLRKSTSFLSSYAAAFRQAGADGLIMAEPTAGLLSPRGLAAFSSAYVREIGGHVENGHFALILHNCAAKAVHLPAIRATGLACFHFGAPMELPAALAALGPESIVCGNLDPAAVFCQATAEQAGHHTRAIIEAMRGAPNFVVSSGCDIPPNSALANLDAFFKAVKGS